ncbi:MAG: helix-turn-helix domain-containing protein, partial [Synergistaceae bacterium]|nr:helix-turn-helix domain-containing protein [Synergistaceae bacterium]
MLVANKNQNTRLFQFAGTARFAYNWALEQEKKNYEAGGKFINDYELRKRFTEFKQEADNRWLYTVSNNVCKQAVKDAVNAYRKFFKGLAEHPKYKSRKRSKPSFYVDPIKIKFTETHVKLENIAESKKKNRQSVNWFRLAEHERIPIDAKYFNPRVSFNGLNW